MTTSHPSTPREQREGPSGSETARARLAIRFLGVAFVVFFTIAAAASITRTRTPEILYHMFGWGSVGDAEEVMISAIYIVWGIFLWTAAKEPAKHRVFLDFTVVANAAHFGVMAVQAILMEGERTHLVGDVLVGWVLLIAFAAAWLPVRRKATPFETGAGRL